MRTSILLLTLILCSAASAADISLTISLTPKQIAAVQLLAAQKTLHRAKQGLPALSAQNLVLGKLRAIVNDEVRSLRSSAIDSDDDAVMTLDASTLQSRITAMLAQADVVRQEVLDARAAALADEE